MHLETLKVFCDLADTKSFSKAAEVNGITQSAVSQQVRALEEKYQVTLVERSRKACSLTAEGKVLLEASRRIVEEYRSLGEHLRRTHAALSGRLAVASVFSIGMHELPPRLSAFRTQYPSIDVTVEYRRSPEVYEMVANGRADLGLVSFPQARPGLKFEVFEDDELVLICPPAHPLARRKSIPLSVLSGENFVAFEPDMPTRKVIDRRLRDERVEARVSAEFDNVEMVKRAVEIESGVSLVPRNTVESETQQGTLAAIPVEGKRFMRPLGVLYKAARTKTATHRLFIDALRGERLNGTPELKVRAC
jgi:DNA-binding transcriptional LysR family regulator